MIYEHYDNPNRPVEKAIVAVPYKAGNLMVNGFSYDYCKHHANLKGCTIDEFAKRDKAYRDEVIGVSFYPNEVVYPQQWADYERLGKCRILKVIRTYSDTDREWDEGKPLYVVEATSEKENTSIRMATKNFFGRIMPKPPVEGATA